ncbi:unnamed protein product [Clonostachys rosea f. rosea IK726]|uniref:Uncharacterized protein n=1 Tax=Clonostachys rosea f. rosea IK726 TaxID=1349383 RepID=A0ACA9UF93_BIOOC|nr:unnamed protein product [Clonostachys rosea f. rosea IK726]
MASPGEPSETAGLSVYLKLSIQGPIYVNLQSTHDGAQFSPEKRHLRSTFGRNRLVILPDMTVSMQHILHALEAVAGKNTLFLAKNELDPKLEAIAGTV